jgi:hypothetical protein
LIEKCNEFNKTIFIAFIDYQKAFDSLEHPYIWKALKDQGIDVNYIRIVKKIYRSAFAKIKQDEKTTSAVTLDCSGDVKPKTDNNEKCKGTHLFNTELL